MTKTHYEILGLSKDANENEIKKAYRKLSLEFHPDRNPSDDAKSRFQEISSAYETLSDPDLRRQYDMGGGSPGFPQGFPGGGFPPGFPGFPGGGFPGFPGGGHFTHMSSMDETADIGNIFNMMFGGGMGNGMGPGPGIRIFHNGQQMFHQMQKPQPIVKNIQISLEQCYSGCSVPVDIERWVMNGDIKASELETIYITVPAGISENECIIMHDKGHSVNEQLKGDIKIDIQISNITPFKRQGLDIIYSKTITLKEALCGFSFELKHLSGQVMQLNNITNHTIIKPGFKKTIPNLGMKRDNNQGNMIIDFSVEFPESLTQEQIDSIKAIL